MTARFKFFIDFVLSSKTDCGASDMSLIFSIRYFNVPFFGFPRSLTRYCNSLQLYGNIAQTAERMCFKSYITLTLLSLFVNTFTDQVESGLFVIIFEQL